VAAWKQLFRPLAWLWGGVLRLRHWLYDSRLLPSQPGKLPTIVIGNLALGGTGKTPHAEYVLRQLRAWCKPAFLSRGYGRTTRGFILAGRVQATAQIIGDEPMQVHLKFPDLDVAVCESRVRGLEYLKTVSNANIAVLDDAFQHRKLQGDLKILLTEYDRPYWTDRLLPAGRLRDVRSAYRRADIIIVTKCPMLLSGEEQESIIKAIRPLRDQRVFFTRLEYGNPVQLSGKPLDLNPSSTILGIAGLADTRKFEEQLRKSYTTVHFESFADHHNFSRKELTGLWSKYGNFAQAIVTTEKDAARLKSIRGLNDIPIFVVPVSIAFLSGEAAFVQLLRST
jgi:tetraacyldisaccharide 4'-kinase